MVTRRFILLALITCACSRIESSSVLTSGLSAEYAVTASGSGSSRATAVLHVGGTDSLNFVDLTGSDQLLVTSGTVTQAVDKSTLLGLVSYSATFTGDARDQSFLFNLKRTIDAGAPSSTATLPAAFSITAPAENATVSRANDALTISWSQSGLGDKMRWAAKGSCITLDGQDIDSDSGSVTIAKGRFTQPTQNPPAAATCDVTLTLTRSRPGVLDSHFGKGGTIVGVQSRTLTISSAP